MHEAYTLLPPEKINAQIECIAGYDNFIFLGTRHGHLMQYSIEKNPINSRMSLEMVQYDKNFSKKNIVQIAIVPESMIIFSLSGDKQININDICQHNFPLVYTEPKTRGATVFALKVTKVVSKTGDTSVGIQLCVAVKRKLQFYLYKNDKLTNENNIKDIDLPDVPKTMSWLSDCICLGFDTGYLIYKLDPKELKKYDPLKSSSTRAIIPYPYISTVDDELFALGNNEFTLLVEEKRISEAYVSNLDQKLYQWAQPLKEFVWDKPFAVGLLSDSIEVRDLGTNKGPPLQVFKDLPGVRYLMRTESGLLFAASVSQLWQIKLNDIPTQIAQLNEVKNYALSLRLNEIAILPEEVKQAEKNRIQSLYAYHLFAEKQFEESMNEFIDMKTDPLVVIKLFPGLGLKDTNTSQLETALGALQYFLAAIRPALKKAYDDGNTNPEFYGRTAQAMLSIVDTTMLNCYLQTKDSLVAILLRQNHCQLEESERLLKKHQKHRELILLYQLKGQPRMALELLKSMADSNGTGINAITETISYLQSLSSEHMPLIWEYSSWVLERDPIEGLEIFTADIDTVVKWPRDLNLDFLLKNHESVVIPYLEHLINNWKESKPLFHNSLIKVYRDKIREIELKNGKESDEGGEYRQKLRNFLKKSESYNAEIVLMDFPTNDFFEERTILLKRSNQHRKVLQVFICVLGDYEAALEYCKSVYKPRPCPQTDNKTDKDDSAQDVFYNLIEILLTQPLFHDIPLHENCLDKWLMMEQVFSILDNYGTKVNPYKVLEVLPDDVPLERLKKFLETALHFQLEQRRQNQILGGLLYADNLSIHEERIRFESQSVTISEFSVCANCKKKFNNQSAFVRYPNGEIVHYSCQQKYKL